MDEAIPRDLLEALRPHTGAVRATGPVGGGITNRNFRLEAEKGVFMLRLPGAKTGLLGIDRACEHGCAVLAARAGAGAPVVAFVEGHGALLTRFIEGAAALTPATASDPERLGRIVEAIRSYHEGPAFPGRFDPFATVRAYHGEALRHGVVFPSDLGGILARMEEWESALGPHAEVRRCHNDLLPGNLLDDGRRIWIVDWE